MFVLRPFKVAHERAFHDFGKLVRKVIFVDHIILVEPGKGAFDDLDGYFYQLGSDAPQVVV